MTQLSKNARIVGVWYLLLVITGVPALIYVPAKLFVHGDATATAVNIAAHPTLFQFGIASGLISAVVTVFLALAFYRLFKEVDRYQAALLVITGGIMTPAIGFASTASSVATLVMVQGANYLNVFDAAQRDAFAYFFVQVSSGVTICSEILWGVWLFPMAILILKSRWFPRFLGWWLVVNGIAYLVLSFAGMFMQAEHYNPIVPYFYPLLLGELAFLLWALIMGARERPVAPPRHKAEEREVAPEV